MTDLVEQVIDAMNDAYKNGPKTSDAVIEAHLANAAIAIVLREAAEIARAAVGKLSIQDPGSGPYAAQQVAADILALAKTGGGDEQAG